MVTLTFTQASSPAQITQARELKLFAEGLSQKRGVNLYPAVRVGGATVFDEAEHSELIHKKVYAAG